MPTDKGYRTFFTLPPSRSFTVHLHRSWRKAFWPGGRLGDALPPRTDKEKENSRLEAKARLIINIPNDFKRIVGGHNCRQGTLRVLDMMQHRLMNKRLLYALLEVCIVCMFKSIATNVCVYVFMYVCLYLCM